MLREMRGGLPQKKTRAIQKIVAAETKQLLHGRRGKPKNHQNPPTQQPRVEEEEAEEEEEEVSWEDEDS